jgi:transcription elongation factor GreB
VSRAFVKDDAPDGPQIIPPRPALPSGVANYVTPRGLRQLKEELTVLEAKRGQVGSAKNRHNADVAHELSLVKGLIAQLENRIASARMVDPAGQPPGEARFGATITLRSESGLERTLTIVGVDEANAAEGRIGFLAPVARRMTGGKVGDSVPMPSPKGEEPFKIISISYLP